MILLIIPEFFPEPDECLFHDDTSSFLFFRYGLRGAPINVEFFLKLSPLLRNLCPFPIRFFPFLLQRSSEQEGCTVKFATYVVVSLSHLVVSLSNLFLLFQALDPLCFLF